MLVSSIRSQSPQTIRKLFSKFKQNAIEYLKAKEITTVTNSIDDLDISDYDLFNRILEVYAKTDYITDITDNPLATVEMVGFAAPFMESYIAFWDAPDEYEYILSDNAMVSEYEGFNLMTGGIDISKNSYLFSKINDGLIVHKELLTSNIVMYENYNLFNLSSKRSVVMINPFFKLYQSEKLALMYSNLDVKKLLPKPDIWPAIIQDQSLFETPNTKYMLANTHTMQDEFIYDVKTLNKDDLFYINALITAQTKEFIGYKDLDNIIESIYFSIWSISKLNSITTKNQSNKKTNEKLLENLKKSPYKVLYEHSNKKSDLNSLEIMLLFDKVLSNIYKDFNENKYIANHYLSIKDKIVDFKPLDFLGEGHDKITFFKNHLNKILENEFSK